MSKSTAKDVPPSFEEAMDELDGIVQAMEGDRLSLAELIEQYARGMKLEKVCREQLAVARQRVDSITAAAEGGGEVEVTPFDPAAEAARAAAEAKGGGGEGGKARPARGGATKKSQLENDDEEDEIRLF